MKKLRHHILDSLTDGFFNAPMYFKIAKFRNPYWVNEIITFLCLVTIITNIQ